MTVTEQVTPEDLQKVAEATRLGPGKEAKVMATLAEQWKQEGEARGRAEGQRVLLTKQLQLKFGPLPTEFVERLETASTAELDQWAERVLKADSLSLVFAP